MISKLVCCLFLSATTFVLNNCSSENKEIAPPEPETAKIETPKTLAAPRQVEVVETPRFKELKKQFESAENEVKQLEDLRNELLITYTEEYSKVKKVSKELDKAKMKLAAIEKLLNAEREKNEYRQKNSSV
jgi:hypothetical protein